MPEREVVAKKSITVKTGSTYSGLSKVTVTPPSGKKFKGWNTQADGKGASINYKSPVPKSASKHTLYAQYEKDSSAPPETKYYTITINPNNGSDPIKKEIKEGESYTLSSKDKPTKTGNRFLYWYDESENIYKPGDEVDAQKTLTAEWRDWKDIYADAAREQSGKTCLIIDSNADKKTFVEACSCSVATSEEEEFDYVIVFDSDPSNAYSTYSSNENYNGKVIALHTKAISSDGYEQLLYKIVLLEKAYGTGVYEDNLKYQDAENDIEKKADFKS